MLEYTRDELVLNETDEFEKSKNRVRSIMIANRRLLDQKMEKPGNYEISPPSGVSIYFLFYLVPFYFY